MIIQLKEHPKNTIKITALHDRERRHQSYNEKPKIQREQCTRVEFRKIVYTMPLLYISGIFTGIFIMLAYQH